MNCQTYHLFLYLNLATCAKSCGTSLLHLLVSSLLAEVFFLSFFTAVISTSIHSHTVRFHLSISTYVVKLVAGTVL